MVTMTVPYLVPLFLGMTFNARYTRPGVDIFEAKWVDDPVIVDYGRSDSTYSIAESMSDIQKALNIEGDIALKIKTGSLDIAGKGAYVKNEVDFNNRIEVLATMHYISKTKSFKEGATPIPNWVSLYNPGVLGTHYVSSITYGAELLASLRFVVSNSNYSSEVRGEVNAALGTGGSGVDLVAEGKLEDLEKKVAGKANLEISYYGTVPLKSIPNTIDGLRKLINNFKEQIEETEMQQGIPLTVDLSPLTTICDPKDKEKFEFLKDLNLENSLKDFEEEFDELRTSRLDLIAWSKTLPYNLQPEFEKEIGSLLKNITLVLEVFYDTVWEMDLTKGREQLDRAFQAYNYDGDEIYRRFDKLVRKLKLKLTPLIKWDDVASDNYIQWGSDNCTAPGTVVLYKGFAFSSVEEGIGGTAAYSCTPKDGKKGYDLAGTNIRSKVSGIRYTDLDKNSNPFKGPNAKKVPGKGLPCAKCYSGDSASVAMFSALDTCPLTWEPMYKGYLMSARKQEGHTTEFICVDEFPSEPVEMQAQPSSKDTVALTVVHSEGSLPKKIYPDSALIKCIVCSMKSNQVVF